jgi:membrane associated rhomboid family serine protease
MAEEEEVLEVSPQEQERERREDAFGEWLRSVKPRAFWWLIAACTAMWLLTVQAGGSTRGEVLLAFGAMSGPLVERGEWWRLFTSGFLHIGFLHLALNMWGVYALGVLLERYFGGWKVLGLFVFAVLGGSVGAWIAYPTGVSAGASGGVFGWFGAVVVIYFKYREKFSKKWGQHLASWIWHVVIANLVLALIFPFIGHAAHLAGFIFGVIYAALVPSRPGFLDPVRPWTRAIAGITLLVAPALALAGHNALQMKEDPWNYPTATYRDAKFEIDYLIIFNHRPEKANIVFEGAGVRIDLGSFTPDEQKTLREAEKSLVAPFPEYTIWFKRIDKIQIRGEPWTRFQGTLLERPIDVYVQDRTQWHVIAWAYATEIESLRPRLLNMAESFRLIESPR